MARDPFTRMMEKVVPVPEAGCWIFIGAWDGGGYGMVSTKHGQPPAKAHRVAYEEAHGPIPEGMDVCHRCDTPACVHPDHLFAGTALDNMRDCAKKGQLSPVSTMNLRPGAPGYYGAGPTERRT